MEPCSQVSLPLPFRAETWTIPAEGVMSISRTLPSPIDLLTAVDQALSTPIQFASISQLVVPGDIVALAVDPETPSLIPVVGAISRWLVENGTEPGNLYVVLASDEGVVDSLTKHLASLGLSAVTISLHDANDPEAHSYVAANDDAEPVYVNRRLVDADVIIPISCSRSKDAVDYLGAFGIFPWFSNRETRGHFHSYWRLVNPLQRDKLLNQADQVAWYLGLLVGIQVVPAADDQVAAVLCGTLAEVERRAQQLLNETRQQSDPADQPADLVIALLDGPYQNWSTVARALKAAQGLCSQDGTIVLCTQLQKAVGASLRRLRDAHSNRHQVEKRLARDSDHDTLAAAVILNATNDHHVYLVSGLRSTTVEELGLGVLETSAQLTSLVQQHSRNLVVYSAQHP